MVFTISADAGFLPSTVSQQLSRLRYFKEILPKHQESGWWTWTFTRLYQTLTIPESLPKRYGMEYLPTWQNHVVHKSIFSRTAKKQQQFIQEHPRLGWLFGNLCADGKSLLLGTMLPLLPDFPFWALPPRNSIRLERWINITWMVGPTQICATFKVPRCLIFVWDVKQGLKTSEMNIKCGVHVDLLKIDKHVQSFSVKTFPSQPHL